MKQLFLDSKIGILILCKLLNARLSMLNGEYQRMSLFEPCIEPILKCPVNYSWVHELPYEKYCSLLEKQPKIEPSF